MKENNFLQGKSLLKTILIGIIIGTASVTPGLSGGIIAVSLGIYTAVIDNLVNIRKNFKQSILYLTPLIIGALIGVVVFGLIMSPLLKNYEISVIYLFLGLVLGSLPSFFKEAAPGGFRPVFILPMLISFTAGMFLSGAISLNGNSVDMNFLTYIISGVIFSIGMIIPGISSSFLLLQMGVYDKIIYAFLMLDINVIIGVAVGFLLFSLLSIKLVHTALKKFHGQTYFAAFGFLLSSMISVFPGFNNGLKLIIDILLFVVGALASYALMKKTK